MKRDHSQACACCFTSVALLLAYFNPEPGIRDDDGVPFRQRPFVETYHYEYLTRSLGLRAPPVC